MAPYEKVMADAGITKDDGELYFALLTGMQRFLNMVGGCRPSDVMRTEVAEYERHGRDEYIRRIHKDGEHFRKLGY
jgi:hypothetical protein